MRSRAGKIQNKFVIFKKQPEFLTVEPAFFTVGGTTTQLRSH